MIDRLRKGSDWRERSGVIWHTQGSGKSLTMVFLVKKMRSEFDLKDFKILRLNYLVDNKTYDVAVTMDQVDGETLSIIDRGLILDTDSALWKIKDKAYSIADGIELARNIMVTILGILAFFLLFYVGYKIVITVKEAMKNE